MVTDLVRSEHRHAGDLKDSLKDGQDQPGVITREGVLINANTRCVLLRELAAEGGLQSQGIRVAVLPADVLEPELLDLEAVLQKQKEHKDEYNLVSELMMLRTLHTEAQMTERQIARRQRLASAKEVTLRFRILDLMERAWHRVEPPLPIGAFARETDKLQNWKELLMAALARKHPDLRFITMSPGNTAGTEGLSGAPAPVRLLAQRVIQPVVFPALGLGHQLEDGGRRIVTAVTDTSLTSGGIYSSTAKKITGPVVDQAINRFIL